MNIKPIAIVMVSSLLMLVIPAMAEGFDCKGGAKQAVLQTGGELLSVSVGAEDDQPVCIITLLIKNGSNQRPKKISVIMPPRIRAGIKDE